MAFSLRENTLKFKTGVEPVADKACSATSGWINVSDAAFIKINKLSFTEELSSSAEATVRSVRIELAGELVSDDRYNHSITTAVQVRNIEFVD